MESHRSTTQVETTNFPCKHICMNITNTSTYGTSSNALSRASLHQFPSGDAISPSGRKSRKPPLVRNEVSFTLFPRRFAIQGGWRMSLWCAHLFQPPACVLKPKCLRSRPDVLGQRRANAGHQLRATQVFLIQPKQLRIHWQIFSIELTPSLLQLTNGTSKKSPKPPIPFPRRHLECMVAASAAGVGEC